MSCRAGILVVLFVFLLTLWFRDFFGFQKTKKKNTGKKVEEVLFKENPVWSTSR